MPSLLGIIAAHIAALYALVAHVQQPASPPIPREVIATFITPERPSTPAPSKAPPPQPSEPAARPKPATAPAVRKQAAPPQPKPNPAPPVNAAPSPAATTAAPAPPVPAPAAPTPLAEPPAAAAPPATAAPPAAPAPAAPAQPKTVSSGIEYLQPPQPVYPVMSKRMGEQGVTVLRVLVNEQGRPERVDVQKSSGAARLDEAARQAALRALFKPFVENGRPVPAYAIVPIQFQLKT